MAGKAHFDHIVSIVCAALWTTRTDRFDVACGTHQPFGHQESGGQLFIMPRRAHGDGETADATLTIGNKVNANLQRLFNRHAVSQFAARIALKSNNRCGNTPLSDIACAVTDDVTCVSHLRESGVTASAFATGCNSTRRADGCVKWRFKSSSAR